MSDRELSEETLKHELYMLRGWLRREWTESGRSRHRSRIREVEAELARRSMHTAIDERTPNPPDSGEG